MNKFKVGDHVRRVSNAFEDMQLGSFWVVDYVPNDEEIRLLGSKDYWLSECFELVGDEGVVEISTDSESKTYNPLVAQEGGGHYKNRGIQPIEYSHANNLSASQHSVVKYITRYYDKGGIEDLSKIVHFVLLEAYFRYGAQGSTELKDKILTILGENKES